MLEGSGVWAAAMASPNPDTKTDTPRHGPARVLLAAVPHVACGRGYAALSLTPVLGEEGCKGALLQQASGVVLLGKLLYLPVINALVVPGLVLLMLCRQKRRASAIKLLLLLLFTALLRRRLCTRTVTDTTYLALVLGRPLVPCLVVGVLPICCYCCCCHVGQ